jgi:plasmid stabilization system protein ParE
MKPVRFILPAENEMLDAALFYQKQAHRLGLDFIEKIEAAAVDIARDPELWPVIQHGVRRRLLQRFPYALLYRIDIGEIVILAVMHLHRRPDYWIDRL